MPLLNSMGALKQQRFTITGTTPTTYQNFYSATDFNLAVDDNKIYVTVINGISYIYGSSSYSGTTYGFVYQLDTGSGAISNGKVFLNMGTVYGFTIDSSNNFHVLLYTTGGATFLKYTNTWSYITGKTFNTGGFANDGKILIDSSNNIYFTYMTTGSYVHTLKIDSSYNFVYQARTDMSSISASYIRSKIDSSGNVFYLAGTLVGDDVMVAKLDSTGTGISWKKKLSITGLLSVDNCFDIDVDSAGDVYTVCGSDDSSGNMYVSKFDTNGTVLYNKIVDVGGYPLVSPSTLVVNSDNNITIIAFGLGSNDTIFVELDSTLALVNQKYITGLEVSGATIIKGCAGTGKVYVPYIDGSVTNVQMMTVLSVPNNGYFGALAFNYSYTYNSNTLSGTLTAYNATTYTVTTNGTGWALGLTSFTTLTPTSSTPTVTTSSVTPFNYNNLM